MLEFVRELVAVPSRGGLDDYGPIIGVVSRRLRERNLEPEVIDGLAVVCEIAGERPGPTVVLDACLDTAPFGDEQAWTHAPTDPVVKDGWLYGRGAADSKAAVAIFCELAATLDPALISGKLVLLFDLDEHTGGFGGAKAYLTSAKTVDAVMIGYPGFGELVVGGRGVHRVRLTVRGEASHTGARVKTANAVEKAARLITELAAKDPGGADDRFPMGARVTVTGIRGGESFSITPDLCTIDVDVRTTPSFGPAEATALLGGVAETVTTWPPYALGPDHPLPAALLAAAGDAGLTVRPKVAGPSNIGNYLAGLGIPATAGFGVDYENLHGTDERIRVDTLAPVLEVYRGAVGRLLTPGDRGG